MTEDSYSSNLTEYTENIDSRALDIRFALESQPVGIALNPSPWILSKEQSIGSGRFCNTAVTLFQVATALALSTHPLIDELIVENPTDIIQKKNWFDRLIESRVLHGLDALDLGCGPVPLASRALRAMGATVYTVDIHPADKFEISNKLVPSSYEQEERLRHIVEERNHHIVMDFYAPDAKSSILKTTGGKLFDHISTSQTCADEIDRKMIATLLKPQGIYLTTDRLLAKASL